MRTPAEWTKNLADGVITEDMLSAALYSVNKRAKNCRDKKREYKKGWDRYHNADRYEEQESAYYVQKEELLSVLSPLCIHREHLGFQRIRHRETDPGFIDDLARCFCAGTICWSNSFVTRDYDYEYDYDYGAQRTYFFDEMLPDQEILHYYLYYAVGDHTFHSPLEMDDAAVLEYAKEHHLDIVDISHLDTKGNDILELCSTAFVSKLLDVIRSEKYSLQILDPRFWFDYDEDGDEYNGNRELDEIYSRNIGNAIEFGWSAMLSEEVLKHFDLSGNKYDNLISGIKKEEEERVKACFEELKPKVQGKLAAFERVLEGTFLSSKKGERRRQMKSLRKQYNHIYCRNTDVGISKHKIHTTDIVGDYFESYDGETDYVPSEAASLKELIDLIAEVTGEDNFPECLSANLRHDIDVDLAVKYEKEYLGEELIQMKKLQKKMDQLGHKKA